MNYELRPAALNYPDSTSDNLVSRREYTTADMLPMASNLQISSNVLPCIKITSQIRITFRLTYQVSLNSFLGMQKPGDMYWVR